jgi:3-phenylpropionate/trans-cinnamate dioxygenase ferredoxin subunit
MDDPPSDARRSAVVAHDVASVSEIPPGGRKLVSVEGRSIGVFNVAGTYYALRNLCPHQQAPLCEGRVLGTTVPSRPGVYRVARDGEILRCPWHGWEFDIRTGASLFDPRRCRVKAYPVTVGDPISSEGEASVETYRVTVEGRRLWVHV